MTRRWLLRDGIRLVVDDADGSGLPVVFQHGLCGDARQTAEAFPVDPRYRRLTVECRGHGGSDAGGPLSIAVFAEDVAALIRTLPGPAVVGGISMGAAIALRLAVREPDLVRGLIMVRPAWGTQPAPENMRPNAEVGELLEKLPPDEARSAFAAGPTAEGLRRAAPDNLASLMGFFDRQPIELTARLLRAISADGPAVGEEDLARLSLPTLICGCAEDAIHPLDLARRLARSIAGAAFVELPPKGRDKAAHIAALQAAISTFLKEFHDAPPAA